MRSSNFEKIIYQSGLSARPGYYSGRGQSEGDLNSNNLEKIHDGLLNSFGAAPASNFVSLVAGVQELSATNFLRALEEFEFAGFVWNPQKHPRQACFCQIDSAHHDMEFDSYGEGVGAFLQAIGRERGQSSRFGIAGEFILNHGDKKQIQDIMGGCTRRGFFRTTQNLMR